jgi:thymidylate synthase
MSGGNNAETHLRQGTQFDHSYAERYWPKYAGRTPGGRIGSYTDLSMQHHRGIRFNYGDLNDLVDVLANEPLTRQAYLPVWFPEDLQACKDKKRVPCTLGYHFIMRDGKLDVTYYIRSCDYVRHFRDDVYLTIRLLLWVLEQCKLAAPERNWGEVMPGHLIMHITSLHMFKADHKRLYKDTVA